MKKKYKVLLLIIVMLSLATGGCTSKDNNSNTSQQKLYFFDQTKNDLVSEPIGDDFYKLKTAKEQVQYIIDHLVLNKSLQLVTLQNSVQIPYLSAHMSDNIEDDPTVKFYFTSDYNNLSAVQKIGMRASIVYSLCELSYISGVDFYVEDAPMVTSMGKPIGVIYPSQIKTDLLDPNPATMPYTLSLYYLNQAGKLEKEMRGVLVSDSAAVEKLLIEELIDGPSVEGLQPVMPKEVKINEVKVSNGVCQVDLSFDVKSKFFASDKEKELMIYSMVDSLTEMPQIKKVVFFLDGQSGIAFTKDIDFGDILERSESYISKS